MAKRIRIQRRYLARILLTVALFLVLPISLFLSFLLTRSYNELQRNNLRAYQEITRSFAAYMQTELNAMRNQAMVFAVKSRTDAVFVPGLELLKSNPYYFKRMTEILHGQNSLTEYDMLLYYGNLDSVFTGQNKYAREEYLEICAQGNERVYEALDTFFNYDADARWVFASTFPLLFGQGAACFIGVPIKVGVDYQEALLVYVLGSGSVTPGMLATQSARYLDLFLFDEFDRLLYKSAQGDEGLLAGSQLFSAPRGEPFAQEIDRADGSYTVFRAARTDAPIQCVTILPSDEIQADIREFYLSTRALVYGMLVMLITLTCSMIYVNYQPIRKLMRRVGDVRQREGELEAIGDEYLRMREEAAETNLLVLESLVANLLYGARVPPELITRTALSRHAGEFCVLTVKGKRFNSAGRARLLEGLAPDADGYITDMLYEDFTVLICLLRPHTRADALKQIRARVAGLVGAADVFVGPKVSALNDIQTSYKSCLAQMHQPPAPPTAAKDGARHKLCEDVLKYVSERLSDPELSQSAVADRFTISTYSLSRLFSEQMGIGFTEYVTAKRLDNAKRLLLTTDMRISDIALAVGVANPNYFSRVFKANFNATPNEFRRQVQG